MAKVALTRPEISDMVKEITAAGFLSPVSDDAHRVAIEHVYYLVVAAQPSMEVRKPDSRCFGTWDSAITVCNGDGSKVKPCCLLPLCREMKRVQEGLKVGVTVESKLSDAVAETAELCIKGLVEAKEKKMTDVTDALVPTPEAAPVVEAPKVKKTRTTNPELLDSYGFRKSSDRSKVIAAIAAGGSKADVIKRIVELAPNPVLSSSPDTGVPAEKAAKQRFNSAKHTLKQEGWIVIDDDGAVQVKKF